jgi:hypothetical protein
MTITTPTKHKTFTSSSTIKKYFTSQTQLHIWDLTDKTEYPIYSPTSSTDSDSESSPYSPSFPTSTFISLKVQTCFSPPVIPWSPPPSQDLDSKILSSPTYPMSSMNCYSPPAIPWSPAGVPVQAPAVIKQNSNLLTVRSSNMSLQDLFLATSTPDDESRCCPLIILFEYLNWWDLSLLDYVTSDPQFSRVRYVLLNTWNHFRILRIQNVYTSYDSPYFTYHIVNLKFFEAPQLLDSKYGLPVCSYLAGLFNRLRELIPGFPDRSYSMDTLINSLQVLIMDPESVFPYLPRLLLHKIHDYLLDFSERVLADHQFRKAPRTSEPWRFNFPVLTHEYLRVCELGCRFITDARLKKIV